MTKTSTKADKPAREVASKGDQSNEGAGAERSSLRSKLRRMREEIYGEAVFPYDKGWIAACDEMRAFLDGRTARFAARPGGLKSPRRAAKGKGARRAS